MLHHVRVGVDIPSSWNPSSRDEFTLTSSQSISLVVHFGLNGPFGLDARLRAKFRLDNSEILGGGLTSQP